MNNLRDSVVGKRDKLDTGGLFKCDDDERGPIFELSRNEESK